VRDFRTLAKTARLSSTAATMLAKLSSAARRGWPGARTRLAAAPRVVSLVRLGVHRQPTLMVVSSSAPLGPARAGDPGDYLLVAPGPDRAFGTRDDRAIPIASAAYDPATLRVTLSPARRLDRHRPFQLAVRGLTGSDGAPLAGATVFRFGRGAVPSAVDRRFGPVGTVGVPVPSWATVVALARGRHARTAPVRD
jgi:hypothetical protein